MTPQDRAFAELARRLEVDLARDTRDLRDPPRPRPGRVAVLAGLGTVVLVLVLGGSLLLTAYGAGIVASVVGLVGAARVVAREW